MFQFNFYFSCTSNQMQIMQKVSYVLKCAHKLKDCQKVSALYFLNLLLLNPVARCKQIFQLSKWYDCGNQENQRSQLTHSSLVILLWPRSQRRHLSSTFYVVGRERSARETPWTEEENKKSSKMWGKRPLPWHSHLVHIQTLYAAAGGVAETAAERLGNLPLEGWEGEPRINLKGIEGTQTQMFWRITPRLCGPLENDLTRECINNFAAVISNRATTFSVQRGKEKSSYLKRRARKGVDCPPGHSPSVRDPHLLRFLQ